MFVFWQSLMSLGNLNQSQVLSRGLRTWDWFRFPRLIRDCQNTNPQNCILLLVRIQQVKYIQYSRGWAIVRIHGVQAIKFVFY